MTYAEIQLRNRVQVLEAEISALRADVRTLTLAVEKARGEARTARAAFARPLSPARLEAARAGGIARAASAVRFADGTFASYEDEAADEG